MGNEIKLLNNELLLSTVGGSNEIIYEEAAVVGKTITVVSNDASDPVISTTQKKFGTSSCYFSGSAHLVLGSYLSIANNTAWDLGTGKFTIDGWFYADGTTNSIICSLIDGSTSFWTMLQGTPGTGINNSGSWKLAGNGTEATTPNQWQHIAIVRDGTTSADWHFFLDGVKMTNYLQLGSWSASYYNNAFSPLRIGDSGNNHAHSFKGYMDEFRFSKGVARWTSNFTPPTAAYTTDANTDLLLHFEGSTFVDSSGKA
jgi:hypothetical protein